MLACLAEFERCHVRPAPGRALIVGSKVYPGRVDRRPQHDDALGVDMEPGEGVDLVADLEERADFGPFAHVECLSVLEHSRRPWLLAHNLEEMLLAGGTLFVAAPFAWREHAYPDDYWRFTRSGLAQLFPRIKWEAIGYAGIRLRDRPKRVMVDGFPHFPRQEVCGFGHRV